MQAHTKKHPIEIIELRFIGPILDMAKAVETLKLLGFVDRSDSIPWREPRPLPPNFTMEGATPKSPMCPGTIPGGVLVRESSN